MNKTYKYTLTAHEKKEISFDTGVARLAIANGDGVDGSTTVIMSEITKQHSGDLVSFIDGADAPFADLTVNIVATQSGSGDPSPTNVRPITGWNGANVYVSGEDTSDPTTYNINWQSIVGTVGLGTLNPLTGVLIVTSIIKKFNEMSWNVSSSDQTKFYASFTPNYKSTYTHIMCSHFKNDGIGNQSRGYYGAENTFRYYDSDTISEIYIKTDTNYASIEDFLAVFGDADFYYELIEPVVYHLTPVEIRSILGLNNVWADCGPVDVRYFVQSTQPMIDYIDEQVAKDQYEYELIASYDNQVVQDQWNFSNQGHNVSDAEELLVMLAPSANVAKNSDTIFGELQWSSNDAKRAVFSRGIKNILPDAQGVESPFFFDDIVLIGSTTNEPTVNGITMRIRVWCYYFSSPVQTLTDVAFYADCKCNGDANLWPSCKLFIYKKRKKRR